MVSINNDALTEKILAGERITAEEALLLYEWPLEELGALADQRRRQAKRSSYNGDGNEIVTYIVDRNINYTNVCNVYCKFCAFYRTEKDDDHYVISLEQIDQKLDELSAVGGVQILMQGGHHPKLAIRVVSRSCCGTSARNIRTSTFTDLVRRSFIISRKFLECRCVK